MELEQIDETHFEITVKLSTTPSSKSEHGAAASAAAADAQDETESPSFNFNFFGCGGTGKPDQYRVGKSLAKVAKLIEAQTTFILGDMFYNTNPKGKMPNDGIHGDSDEKWFTSFAKPYHSLPHVFAAVGNHEIGAHATKQIARRTSAALFRGAEAALSYVSKDAAGAARTAARAASEYASPTADLLSNFLQKRGYKRTYSDGTGTYDGPELDIGEKGYYCVSFKIPGRENPAINVFVLNSNTFPHDTEQQSWLREELDSSTADKNILFGHHPVATYNKLKFKTDDAYNYSYPLNDGNDGIEQTPYTNEALKTHPLETVREHYSSPECPAERNFNDVYALSLIDVLGELIKKVDLIGCAHAHQKAMSVLNDHPLFEKVLQDSDKHLIQVIAGTGGGTLQPVEWLGHQPFDWDVDFGFFNLAYHPDTTEMVLGFVKPDQGLVSQHRFDALNKPTEIYNSQKKNNLYAQIDAALTDAVAKVYSDQEGVKLDEGFTKLLIRIRYIASINHPVFEEDPLGVLRKALILQTLAEASETGPAIGVVKEKLQGPCKITSVEIQAWLRSLRTPQSAAHKVVEDISQEAATYLETTAVLLANKDVIQLCKDVMCVKVTSTQDIDQVVLGNIKRKLQKSLYDVDTERLKEHLITLISAKSTTASTHAALFAINPAGAGHSSASTPLDPASILAGLSYGVKRG